MQPFRIALIGIGILALCVLLSHLLSGSAQAQPPVETQSFDFQGVDGWWRSCTNCYTAAKVSGRIVSGDFNGDERADIAAMYDYGNAQSTLHVWLSTGSAFAFQGISTSGWWHCATTNCYASENAAGRFVSGDFNGDGRDDIAAMYDYGFDHAKLHVWLSTGSAFVDQGADGWWQCMAYNCYSAPNATGRLVSGDYNSDGRDDITVLYDYGNAQSTLHVWLSTGSAFAFQGISTSGWWHCATTNCYSGPNVAGRLVSGDFNADGRDDIAAFYDYGNDRATLHTWLSTGSAFSYQGNAGWWRCLSDNCYSTGNVPGRMVSGDFDNDGRDDIATLYDYGNARSVIHTWLSTGFSFAFQGTTGWWQCRTTNCYSGPNVAGRFVTGDFNGDGRGDLSALYDYGNDLAALHTWLASSALQVHEFDLAISLYNSPADHAPHNRILEYFADAIYEMSNGAQRVANVTVYQNGQNAGAADIVWVASTWPHSCVAGRGKGCSIGMGDVFSFPSPYQALNPGNWRGAGYTLAHEWGHYYYGLYDEYVGGAACDDPEAFYSPQQCDVGVPDAVMNSQWNAMGGNYHWLNFSISTNQTRRNVNWRVYGASGWEVVARSPWWDPRDGQRRAAPRRAYYPELAAVAPRNGATSSIELPAPEARSALNVVWVTPSVGSLTTTPSRVYSLIAESIPDTGVVYPEAAVFTARLATDGGFVTNALVTATLTAPNNVRTSLTLKDDGHTPDARAADGIYAASWLYYENGSHHFEVRFTNPAGNARVVYVANNYTVGPNGEINYPPSTPVTDSFDESSGIDVVVVGWPPTSGSPPPPTIISPDNRDYPGRLNGAGDMNTFVLTANETAEIVLRVTDLDLGMQPHIRIWKGEGTPILLGDYQFFPQGDRYFFTYLQAQAGDVFTVEVMHTNPGAVTGLYNISAGVALPNTIEQLRWHTYLALIRK